MRRHRIVLIILALVLFVNFNIKESISQQKEKEKERQEGGIEDLYKEIELFSDSVSVIRSDYVDEVKAKDLI